MPALEDERFEIQMPPGWHPMPAPGSTAAATWPADTAIAAGFTGRDGLLAVQSLASALEVAASQDRPKRLRWVFLGVPPKPMVQAWAFVDVVPRLDADAVASADAYEAGARHAAGTTSATQVWHREISRRIVGAQPAVMIHDLLTIPAPEVQRVQHRAVLSIFPPEQILVSLTLSSPQLAALPDIESTALAMAEGIRIGVPA